MNISEPGWHTNEQGVDDSDDDTDSDVKNNTDWVSSMVLMNTQWGVYWNCQYIYAYSSIRNVFKYSIIDYKKTGFMYSMLVSGPHVITGEYLNTWVEYKNF